MTANSELLSPGASDARRRSGGASSEHSLWTIMSDPVLKDRMFYFCAKQYSEENVLFLDEYITIHELKSTEDPVAIQSIKIQLSDMFDKYFGDNAPMELNIPIHIKKKLVDAWESIADYESVKVSEVLENIFEEPFDHIKQLVQTSVIIPFLKETRDEITNIVK
jgi:hypothetical protein